MQMDQQSLGKAFWMFGRLQIDKSRPLKNIGNLILAREADYDQHFQNVSQGEDAAQPYLMLWKT